MKRGYVIKLNVPRVGFVYDDLVYVDTLFRNFGGTERIFSSFDNEPSVTWD